MNFDCSARKACMGPLSTLPPDAEMRRVLASLLRAAVALLAGYFYLDQVLPSPVGVRKHWAFPLQAARSALGGPAEQAGSAATRALGFGGGGRGGGGGGGYGALGAAPGGGEDGVSDDGADPEAGGERESRGLLSPPPPRTPSSAEHADHQSEGTTAGVRFADDEGSSGPSTRGRSLARAAAASASASSTPGRRRQRLVLAAMREDVALERRAAVSADPRVVPLVVRGVRKAYEGAPRAALRGVSLAVEGGCFVLLGPNGECGER